MMVGPIVWGLVVLAVAWWSWRRFGPGSAARRQQAEQEAAAMLQRFRYDAAEIRAERKWYPQLHSYLLTHDISLDDEALSDLCHNFYHLLNFNGLPARWSTVPPLLMDPANLSVVRQVLYDSTPEQRQGWRERVSVIDQRWMDDAAGDEDAAFAAVRQWAQSQSALA